MKKNDSIPILFFHNYKKLPYNKKNLLQLATEIYTKENVSLSLGMNVILCSDYYIKKLNSQYRDINKPTDVLSFPFNESDFLGEIYISLQRTAVQAKRFGHSYDKELERLLVHGIFHLLGYDHITEKDRKIMESREQIYCSL